MYATACHGPPSPCQPKADEEFLVFLLLSNRISDSTMYLKLDMQYIVIIDLAIEPFLRVFTDKLA